MEVVNKLTHGVNSGLEYLNSNRILSTILGLFLVLYAALAAPKLPKSISSWFDNVWFKLGFMFLIAYMATRDPSVAIISAVALLVTLQTLSAQKTAETVVKSVQSKIEQFSQDKHVEDKNDNINHNDVNHDKVKHDEVKHDEHNEDDEDDDNEVKGVDTHASTEHPLTEQEQEQDQDNNNVHEQEHEHDDNKSACDAPENLVGYDGHELAAV